MSDYIPAARGPFFEFQKNLIEQVEGNFNAWGIPQASVDALIALRDPYAEAFDRTSKKGSRSAADNQAYIDTKKAFVAGIRLIVNQFLTSSTVVSNEQRVMMGLTIKDSAKSERAAVPSEPAVKLTATAGGRIQIECRANADSTRPSMHKLADVVEIRYLVGNTAPATPEDCHHTESSSKSKFFIENSIADAGKKFYAFARWRNISDKSKSGPWSKLVASTIVE